MTLLVVLICLPHSHGQKQRNDWTPSPRYWCLSVLMALSRRVWECTSNCFPYASTVTFINCHRLIKVVALRLSDGTFYFPPKTHECISVHSRSSFPNFHMELISFRYKFLNLRGDCWVWFSPQFHRFYWCMTIQACKEQIIQSIQFLINWFD